ncbi:hypothetical protein LBMAG42_27330 [Deltaproteobacteria bacterium]|nr:hypothetical protein LBMAG42_27330 [Deltaproteobacteria bacterium]
MSEGPWTQHAPGLWFSDVVTSGNGPLRQVALRLADGDLVVVSPIGSTPEPTHEALLAIGTPSLLLAPNFFHNLGLKRWIERHPHAVTVATEAATGRLRRKTPVPIHAIEGLRERLPPHVTLIEPPFTRTGEVWLRVEGEGGVGWVVCDAFFNFPNLPSGVIGWFIAATFNGPGLAIGGTFRVLALRDRPAYAAWLRAQIAADRPVWIAPSHGDLIAGPKLPERLQRLVNASF